MSVSTPLLDNTIEPDEAPSVKNVPPKPQSARKPVVLAPGSGGTMAASQSDAESGVFPCISSCSVLNAVQA